jgi:hypothetical protein
MPAIRKSTRLMAHTVTPMMARACSVVSAVMVAISK